jgi:hypothetical protein
MPSFPYFRVGGSVSIRVFPQYGVDTRYDSIFLGRSHCMDKNIHNVSAALYASETSYLFYPDRGYPKKFLGGIRTHGHSVLITNRSTVKQGGLQHEYNYKISINCYKNI